MRLQGFTRAEPESDFNPRQDPRARASRASARGAPSARTTSPGGGVCSFPDGARAHPDLYLHQPAVRRRPGQTALGDDAITGGLAVAVPQRLGGATDEATGIQTGANRTHPEVGEGGNGARG
jgi:hypothetical protein